MNQPTKVGDTSVVRLYTLVAEAVTDGLPAPINVSNRGILVSPEDFLAWADRLGITAWTIENGPGFGEFSALTVTRVEAQSDDGTRLACNDHGDGCDHLWGGQRDLAPAEAGRIPLLLLIGITALLTAGLAAGTGWVPPLHGGLWLGALLGLGAVGFAWAQLTSPSYGELTIDEEDEVEDVDPTPLTQAEVTTPEGVWAEHDDDRWSW